MSEAELMSTFYSSIDSLWGLMQYWTSISMGVLIGSYFVASKLNRFVIASFLLIYILFTLQIATINLVHMQVIQGVAMDLQQLAASGITLSNAVRGWLENDPLLDGSMWLKLNSLAVFLMMFVATISYPIYCKLKASD